MRYVDIPFLAWIWLGYHVFLLGGIFMTAAALSDKMGANKPDDRNSENYVIIAVVSAVVLGVFYAWLKLPYRPLWAQALFGVVLMGVCGALMPREK